MGFSVNRINKDIVHLEFDTKYNMNNYMLRFQEHYESPEFSGKIFTLGEYREWYIKTTGDFNYHNQVEGMNFQSRVFDPFLRGLFDPLTEEEKELVERVGRGSSFKYLIGTFEGGDHDVYEHEVCHALFGTNDNYKKQIEKVLKKYDLKKISKWLKNQEYGEHVLLDEIHAYVICNLAYLKEAGLEVDDKMHTELLKIRRKFKPKTVY